MFKRVSIFLFGVVSYALFFATFLYAVGFIGNFSVPRTLDGAPTATFTMALLVNLGLLGVFAVQHSVMARPAFKRWFTRVVPESAERSTYVLFSSIALIALFTFWQPLGGVVWAVSDPALRGVLWGCFVFGWLLVLVSTFLINHFDLFGLRQVWLQLVERPYTPLAFRTPGPYLFVRHPLYVGWLFAFWATPTMTISHLLFAIATTAYILIAIRFEERDLVAHHGAIYQEYVEQVPMLVPFTRKRNVDVAFLRRQRLNVSYDRPGITLRAPPAEGE
ncbi:MAG TPA: isoprenylcysteine carboxylmethyltransferase family protein [Steroidobacteraceae bacterium]|nr:isoprenylcysteine carboxylmethyltransferase family protein [Steroidobacteraceae bacterium]